MEALANIFIYDAKVRPCTTGAAANGGEGGGEKGHGRDAACGNQIALRIERASACFPAILGIQITVVPYLPTRK